MFRLRRNFLYGILAFAKFVNPRERGAQGRVKVIHNFLAVHEGVLAGVLSYDLGELREEGVVISVNLSRRLMWHLAGPFVQYGLYALKRPDSRSFCPVITGLFPGENPAITRGNGTPEKPDAEPKPRALYARRRLCVFGAVGEHGSLWKQRHRRGALSSHAGH